MAGLVIAAAFMVVEAVGGFWAHSIAIWTDAAHLLSDVSGFAVALVAARIAARAAEGDHTFGYHRIEVLGALASVAMTWFVTGILVIEAAGRVAHPKPVDGRLMFILAATGVGVNLLLMGVLGGHHHHGPGGHDHGHDHDHGHGHGHGHSHGHGGHGEGGGHSHGSGGCGPSHSHSHAHAHPRPSQPGDELTPVTASGSDSGTEGSDAGEEEDEMEKGPAVPVLALAGAAEEAVPGATTTTPAAHSHGHDDAHRHSINVRGAVLHGERDETR
jgi:zinc transporter 2